MRTLSVTKEQSGQRLDKFLQKYLSQAPKSFLYRMLRKKNIVLNGKKSDGSEKIAVGDEIKLFLSDDTIEKFSRKARTFPYRRLDVIYEDEHVLIVSKPSGMLSQKAKPEDISLNEYVIGYLIHENRLTEDTLFTFRPGICNRLDRNTSGLVLAGKTVTGLQEMSALLKERRVHKYYLCLVHGRVEKGQTIRGYLHKNEKCNKVEVYQTQLPGTSYIETSYEPLCTNGKFTLLKVLLTTGKTHQIRSHLASEGHSIVGDGKYGSRGLNEPVCKKYGLQYQLLHSWKLSFPLLETPFEGLSEKTVTAPPPKLFERILQGEQLGGVDLL